MNILFLLLGFSHQSAQRTNTCCNTSSLSPWFCLAGRRAFGLSCALFLVFWRMWQELLHVHSSLSPSQTAACCLTRRACIQWVRRGAPARIQSPWFRGMNDFVPSGMGPAAPLSAAGLSPAPARRVAASCRRPAAAVLSELSRGIWRAAKSSLFSSGCLHRFSKVTVHSS